MAWPKQPLPSTSPWIRSEGRKMRWARETTRSDSERPMSLRWEAGEPTELEPGDLSVLQLLLRDRQTDGCGVTLVLAWPGMDHGMGTRGGLT